MPQLVMYSVRQRNLNRSTKWLHFSFVVTHFPFVAVRYAYFRVDLG